MIGELEALRGQIDQALALLRRLAAAGLLGDPNAKPSAASIHANGPDPTRASPCHSEAVTAPPAVGGPPLPAEPLSPPDAPPGDRHEALPDDPRLAVCEGPDCGKRFVPRARGPRQKFCSEACRTRAASRRATDQRRTKPQLSAAEFEQLASKLPPREPPPRPRIPVADADPLPTTAERPFLGARDADSSGSDAEALRPVRLPWESNAEASP